MAFALRLRHLRKSSTCPICQKLFRQVTTIAECSHRFCYKCITKKITEEGLHNCPECDVDLGSAPLQNLSVDYHWKRILDEFHEREGDNSSDSDDEFAKESDDELAKERARASQFAKERAKAAKFAKQAMKERSNENQRPIALALPSQRMRGTWRPPPPAKDIVATSTQSRDLRARRRHGENISFRGLINLSESDDDDDEDDDDNYNVEHSEKEEAFWFSLVASDNQKCRAPLKQIPARYLRVKDGNITVSSIRKYLMHKLNLRRETEVEISLQGHVILADLQIRNVVDLWLKTRAPPEKKKALVGSSAGEFVLVLTYARKPMASK